MIPQRLLGAKSSKRESAFSDSFEPLRRLERDEGPQENLALSIAIYAPAAETTCRYRFLVGGSGSGKSVWIAQHFVEQLLSGDFLRVLFIRKIAKTCKRSTFQALLDVLEARGQRGNVKINRTDLTLSHGKNQILHAGLDDMEKIKSIAGGLGLTDIVIEEATELSYGSGPGGVPVHDFDLLALRLRGKQARQITFVCNPGSGFEYYAERFGLSLSGASDDFPPVRSHGERGDVYAQHTTYLDNPHADHKVEAATYAASPGSIQTVYELGLYAQTDLPDQLISYALWKAALDRDPEVARSAGGGRLRLGVDIAWQGADDSAIAYLDGYFLEGMESFHGQNPTRTGDLVKQAIEERGYSAEYTAVDDIGMGATVKSNLHTDGYEVQGFTAGASAVAFRESMPHAMRLIQFQDVRAQAWWFLRCLLEDGLFAVGDLPADMLRRLREEVLAPRYRYKEKGLVQVEPKQGSRTWGIQPRLGRSTDLADTLVMGLFVEYLIVTKPTSPFFSLGPR